MYNKIVQIGWKRITRKNPCIFCWGLCTCARFTQKDMGTGTSDELQKAFFTLVWQDLFLDVLYSILGIPVNQPANWSRVLFSSCDDSLSQVKCLGSCKGGCLVPWLVASTTRSCVVDSSGEGRKTGRGNQRGDGREEGSALWMEGRCDHLVKWCRFILRLCTIK